METVNKLYDIAIQEFENLGKQVKTGAERGVIINFLQYLVNVETSILSIEKREVKKNERN